MEPILEEWTITLTVRVTAGQRPDKWDWTELLDLATGAGEQAWIESATLNRTDTEEGLGA